MIILGTISPSAAGGILIPIGEDVFDCDLISALPGLLPKLTPGNRGPHSPRLVAQ